MLALGPIQRLTACHRCRHGCPSDRSQPRRLGTFGATPREFESHILRSPGLSKRTVNTSGFVAFKVIAGS
jgi:hypothetical protein